MDKNHQTLSPLVSRISAALKIDLSYILRGGSWLTLGQILSATIALLLSMAFARLVSKEVYGEYKYILSLTSMLGIFSLNGMSVAVTRATSAGFDGTVLKVVKRALMWNAILFPISLIISLYYLFNDNHGLAISFIVFGISSPLISSYGLYDGYLIGKKDFRRSVMTASTTSLLVAIGLIVAMFTNPSPLLLVTIYFALTLIGTLYFYNTTIHWYTPETKSVDPEAVNYGAHLSVMSFFNVVADQLDKVLVFHYLGAAQLAIYSFAIAIPEQIKGVLKNVTVLMLPRFAERSDKEIIRTLWRKMFLYTLAVTAIVLMYIFLAPYIFKFLFPAYAESVYYSRLVVASLFAVIANVPYAAMQARMKKRLLYFFNISSALVQIALFFLLTPTYGLLGAILAIIGGRAYSLVFWTIMSIVLTCSKKQSI